MKKPSAAEQNYLKAIHRLGGAERAVPPHEIADLLKVRAPSVTGMLKRLAKAAWIDYSPGDRVRLSPAGVHEARRVIRRHRLLELFLVKVLGLDWSEVDIEAEALEHAISLRIEQALAAHLGQPTEDPHGHPIPSADGQLEHRILQPLGRFRPGQRVLIREADDADADKLKRWRSVGLVPGAVVAVVGYNPLHETWNLSVGGNAMSLDGVDLVGLCGEEASNGAR